MSDSVTPLTAAYQTPPSMGFSRQEYWSGVPSPSPHRCYRCIKIKSCQCHVLSECAFAEEKHPLNIGDKFISFNMKVNVHLTSIIKSAQIFLIWEHPFNVNLLFLLIISIKVLKISLGNSWSHRVKSELPNSIYHHRTTRKVDDGQQIVLHYSVSVLPVCFPLHREWNFQPNTRKFWHKA